MALILNFLDWAPSLHGQLWIPIAFITYPLFAINAIRYFMHKRYLKQPTSRSFFLLCKYLTLLSPLLWGVLFAQILFHDQFGGSASFIVFLLTAGYAVGATMTLAPARSVVLPYHFLLQSPILAFGWIFFIQNKTDQALMIAIGISIFILYNVLQAIIIRRQLVMSIANTHQLMESKLELEHSERKLREESAKVIQTSRLASLGEMASGLAHEINNPLAIISGSQDLLSRQLKNQTDEVDPQVIETLAKIQRGTQRIKSIVNGLKTFSQQGDDQPYQATTVQQVLTETLEFCQEKMISSSIQFKISGDLNVGISVRPVQISQIILNLINNAVDAVRDTQNPKILFQTSFTDTHVYIDVTDSGPGVSPSIRAKLFTPFATSKEVGKGTGLGLSISRGLAKAHQGELELLESSQGTTFRLTLPRVLSSSIQKVS